MEVPSYIIAVCVIGGIAMTALVVTLLYCWHKKRDSWNWPQRQSLDEDSITQSLKKATPRRKTRSREKRKSDSHNGENPEGKNLEEFFIPTPDSQPLSESFTVEKPQPASSPVETPPPTGGRRLSMTAKIDPTWLNPASKMYTIKQASLQKSTDSAEAEELGAVNFSLKYDPGMSLLTVRVIEARGLTPRDFSGTADPYCRVYLTPLSTKTLQSKVERKTLNPQFKENFVFEVSQDNLAEQTIRIDLYDFDQYSRDECIGSVEWNLGLAATVDFTESMELWRSIKPPENKHKQIIKGPELGDLMLSLAYLPSAERLTVVILKARNLRPVDEKKNSADPYVKGSLYYGEKRLKKKKTSTKHSNLHPVFNEALIYKVGQEFLSNILLEFHVIHENRLGQNEVLGRVIIGPNSEGEELTHWNEMKTTNKPIARWHKLFL